MINSNVSKLIQKINDLQASHTQLFKEGKLVYVKGDPSSVKIEIDKIVSKNNVAKEVQNQELKEEEMILSQKLCYSGDNNVIEILRNLGSSDIKEYLIDNVTSYNTQIAYKCVIDEILDTNEQDFNDTKEDIKNLDSILDKSTLSKEDKRKLKLFSKVVLNSRYTDINKIKKMRNSWFLKQLSEQERSFSKMFFKNILDIKYKQTKTLRLKIGDFLSNMKRIGADSANGIAMISSVGNNTAKTIGGNPYGVHPIKNFGNIIVKVPRNPDNSAELVHEAVVGNYLNELRKKCPHFSMVYDTYFEGLPIDSKTGQIVQEAVYGEDVVSHAVYEAVNNPQTLPDCEDEMDLAVYFTMTVSGLILANDEFNFTHYDAHDDNVLTYDSKRKDEPYIPYNIRGFNFWLKCRKGRFPMFIDYGMSHVSDGKNHFGVMESSGYFSSLSIYRDQSNFVSDPFKLICMIAKKLFFNKNKIVKNTNLTPDEILNAVSVIERKLFVCRRVLGYFFNCNSISINDLRNITTNLWDCRYHVQLQIVNEYNWKMSEILDRCIEILQEFNSDLYVTEEPSNVLGSNSSEITFQQALKGLGAKKPSIINAENLYIERGSKSYETKKEIFETNNDSSLKEDEARLTEFLEYSWDYLIVHMPRNRSDITEIIKDNYDDNIVSLASFVQKMSKFSNLIDEFCDASKITDNYKDIYKTAVKKYKELLNKVNENRELIISNYKMLTKFVFNHSEEPSSEEISNAERREEKKAINLYPLYSKYRSVTNSFLELKQHH